MKPLKHKESHTSPSKIGMGDHYGSALKNKIGRVREDSTGHMDYPSKRQTKPPKKLA